MNQALQKLPGHFSVRRAEKPDANAISALLQESFAEFRPLYTPEAFAATVLPASRILVRMDEGPIWVAESESALIGTVGAVVAADSVIVRGMAASPLARGLGVGKFLLREVELFAAKQGVCVLTLFTTPFLHRAIRLYEEAGFSFTGEKVSPHGTELLRMTKVLNP